jgi:hypothetical protein
MEKEKNNQDRLPELNDMLPTMNVSIPEKKESAVGGDISNLISDEQLIGVYNEIFVKIKQDREQVDYILDNFVNMVINDGDSTSASKEALVNLIKIKTDQADKMTKVADLMTRIKMKEKDTFPRYLAQNNTINVGDGGNKRAIIEAINKAKKEKDQTNET